MPAEPHMIVTISRQMGSAGTILGQRVARRLRFAYFDREILSQAAQTLGLEESDLARYEERTCPYWERVLATLAAGTPATPYDLPPLPMAFDSRLQEAEQRIVRDLASRCDAVVVGRGAGAILRAHPGAVRIFAWAPLEARVETILRAYHLPSHAEARRVVEQCDHDRRLFAQRLFHLDWTDARHYDLCLDMSRTGMDPAEKMVLDLVAHRAAELGRELPAPAAPA